MKYKVGCKYIYSKGCFDVYVHCIDEEGKRRVCSNLRTMTSNVVNPGETSLPAISIDDSIAGLLAAALTKAVENSGEEK
jgi:hypothetical protein